MMIDIENGIVDLDIIKVCKTTKFDEFEALSDKQVEKSLTKRGSHFYELISPIVKDGISMHVSVLFSYRDNRAPSIVLRPYIKGDCRDAFNASHKWIEGILDKQIDVTTTTNQWNNQSYPSFKIHTEKINITSQTAYNAREGFEFGGAVDIDFE